MTDHTFPPEIIPAPSYVSAFDQRLRELTTVYATRNGLDPDATFNSLQALIDSKEVSLHRAYEAAKYVSCTPREEVTYEVFWELLTHRRLT